MFGKCKVCAEKNERISDLKSELLQLRKLVFVNQSASHLPIVNIEANKILNGDTEIMEITPEEVEQLDQEAIAAEADRIFNANY